MSQPIEPSPSPPAFEFWLEYLARQADLTEWLITFEDALIAWEPIICQRLLREAHQLAKTPAQQALIHYAEGRFHAQYGRWPEAEACYRSALATEITDVAIHGHLLGELGMLHRIRGNGRAALKTHRQQLQLGQAHQIPDLAAEAYNQIGLDYEALHRWGKAYYHLQRASKLWQDLGDALNTASTQKQLGLVLWQQGKLEESQISLEQARQYFEQIGYPYDVAQVTGNLGNIHATQGDWAQAEQHYLHALKLLDEVNAPFDKIGILNNLGGLALLRRENLEEATFFYEESLALARDLGNQPGIRDALLNLAVVNLHRHQWDVARQHYVEALAVAQTQKHGRMIWHIRYRLLRFSILYTLLRGVAWLRYSLTGRSEGDVQDRL